MSTQTANKPSNGTPAATKPVTGSELTERIVEFVPFAQKEAIKLSVGIVKGMLCKPTKSGAVCSDDQAMRFIMLCKARQLNPFEGDAFITGYDTKDGPEFNLVTAHQAFLKRAEMCADFNGMDSGVIVKTKDGQIKDLVGDFYEDDQVLLGGWAVVYRRNIERTFPRRLKLSVYNKGFARWNVDPGGMIVKCAEADALRSAFPTVLGSLYLEEELGGMIAAKEEKQSPPVGRQSIRKPAAIAAQPLPMPAHFEQRQAEAAPLPKPAVVVQEPLAEGEVDPAEELRERVREAGRALKFTPEKWSNLLSFFQVRTIDRLTAQQCESMLLQLEEMMERDAQGGEERTDF